MVKRILAVLLVIVISLLQVFANYAVPSLGGPVILSKELYIHHVDSPPFTGFSPGLLNSVPAEFTKVDTAGQEFIVDGRSLFIYKISWESSDTNTNGYVSTPIPNFVYNAAPVKTGDVIADSQVVGAYQLSRDSLSIFLNEEGKNLKSGDIYISGSIQVLKTAAHRFVSYNENGLPSFKLLDVVTKSTPLLGELQYTTSDYNKSTSLRNYVSVNLIDSFDNLNSPVNFNLDYTSLRGYPIGNFDFTKAEVTAPYATLKREGSNVTPIINTSNIPVSTGLILGADNSLSFTKNPAGQLAYSIHVPFKLFPEYRFNPDFNETIKAIATFGGNTKTIDVPVKGQKLLFTQQYSPYWKSDLNIQIQNQEPLNNVELIINESGYHRKVGGVTNANANNEFVEFEKSVITVDNVLIPEKQLSDLPSSDYPYFVREKYTKNSLIYPFNPLEYERIKIYLGNINTNYPHRIRLVSAISHDTYKDFVDEKTDTLVFNASDQTDRVTLNFETDDSSSVLSQTGSGHFKRDLKKYLHEFTNYVVKSDDSLLVKKTLHFNTLNLETPVTTLSSRFEDTNFNVSNVKVYRVENNLQLTELTSGFNVLYDPDSAGFKVDFDQPLTQYHQIVYEASTPNSGTYLQTSTYPRNFVSAINASNDIVKTATFQNGTIKSTTLGSISSRYNYNDQHLIFSASVDSGSRELSASSPIHISLPAGGHYVNDEVLSLIKIKKVQSGVTTLLDPSAYTIVKKDSYLYPDTFKSFDILLNEAVLDAKIELEYPTKIDPDFVATLNSNTSPLLYQKKYFSTIKLSDSIQKQGSYELDSKLVQSNIKDRADFTVNQSYGYDIFVNLLKKNPPAEGIIITDKFPVDTLGNTMRLKKSTTLSPDGSYNPIISVAEYGVSRQTELARNYYFDINSLTNLAPMVQLTNDLDPDQKKFRYEFESLVITIDENLGELKIVASDNRTYKVNIQTEPVGLISPELNTIRVNNNQTSKAIHTVNKPTYVNQQIQYSLENQKVSYNLGLNATLGDAYFTEPVIDLELSAGQKLDENSIILEGVSGKNFTDHFELRPISTFTFVNQRYQIVGKPGIKVPGKLSIKYSTDIISTDLQVSSGGVPEAISNVVLNAKNYHQNSAIVTTQSRTNLSGIAISSVVQRHNGSLKIHLLDESNVYVPGALLDIQLKSGQSYVSIGQIASTDTHIEMPIYKAGEYKVVPILSEIQKTVYHNDPTNFALVSILDTQPKEVTIILKNAPVLTPPSGGNPSITPTPTPTPNPTSPVLTPEPTQTVSTTQPSTSQPNTSESTGDNTTSTSPTVSQVQSTTSSVSTEAPIPTTAGRIEIPTDGTVIISRPPTNGIIELDPNGEWTYIPLGPPTNDSFIVEIVDKDGNITFEEITIDLEEVAYGPALPQTGQSNNIFIGIFSIILILAGIILFRKNNK